MDDYPVSGTFETQLQRQEFNPPPMNATLDDEEDVDEADEPGQATNTQQQMHYSHSSTITASPTGRFMSTNPSPTTSTHLSQPNQQLHETTPAGYYQEISLKQSLPSVVAGVSFSPTSDNITDKELPKKRGNGQRSVDKKPRKSRTCRSCGSQECPGRGPTGKCNNA